MELQAKVTALEEEVSMLKGEIKAILQEVRVAVLARQNPFIVSDLEKAAPSTPAINAVTAPDAPLAQAPEAIDYAPAERPAAGRTGRLARASRHNDDEPEDSEEPGRTSFSKRPVDLAALMVWLQQTAEVFSHSEFVMLITMASYADLLDEGLKQALFEMSQEITRTHSAKASIADFSLALKRLEAVRTSAGRGRNATQD